MDLTKSGLQKVVSLTLKTAHAFYLFDGVFVAQAAVWTRAHVYVGWKVVTFGLQS